MLVSFVIPCYNEENYLASCISAIQSEIFRAKIAAEIIVVNNNSTDGTRNLATRLGVIVIDEEKRGVVAARRAGYLRSCGEFIANIDADTIIPEGWITKALSKFYDNPKLVAISGPLIYYDMTPFQRFIIGTYYRVAMGIYFMVKFLHLGSMLQGGNSVVSREALTQADSFNPNFSFYGEDTELARCLSKVGEVKFSLGLAVRSSGRRLNQQGMIKTGLIYTINYFWTIFFKRPYTVNWTDCR